LTEYPISIPYVKGEPIISALSGPTCDSFDMIREDILLPLLNVGDLVVAKMIGAYTWASATTFNSFPKTKVVVVDSDIKESNSKESEETSDYATSSDQELEHETHQLAIYFSYI